MNILKKAIKILVNIVKKVFSFLVNNEIEIYLNDYVISNKKGFSLSINEREDLLETAYALKVNGKSYLSIGKRHITEKILKQMNK